LGETPGNQNVRRIGGGQMSEFVESGDPYATEKEEFATPQEEVEQFRTNLMDIRESRSQK
jgi:hypothetical protein